MDKLPPIEILGAVGLLGAIGYLFMLVSPKALKWCVMVMLFVASCAIIVQPNGTVNRTFLFNIQIYRNEIMIALGFALATAGIANLGNLRGFKIGAQTVILVLILLYMSLIRPFHYGPLDGAQTFAMGVLTLLPIAFIVTGSIKSWDDFYTVFRIIPVFAMLYIGAVVLQTLLNYHEMTIGAGKRFCAFTGNPQHAAVLFGPLCGMLVFSVLNEPVKFLRLLWLGTLGGGLICLIATESRTGLLMAVLTTSGVLYQRLGTAIFVAPIIGLLGVAGLSAAESLGVELGLDRFTSTEDTRSGAWLGLWTAAQDSPIIGKPMDEISGSENSLLNGFASYGVGMLILLLVFMLISAFTMLTLFRLRKRVPKKHRQIVDVIMGYNAAYFAGAMFEGYMVSRVAFSMLLIHFFAALAAKVIVLAKAEATEPEYMVIPEGPDDWHNEWANPEQLIYTQSYTR